METTIQISKELLESLKKMKVHEKESYENLIWDLIEDRMELSEETMRDIEESKKQIKEGKTTSLEDIKKKLKI
jgi:predicted CopG family antitoxin